MSNSLIVPSRRQFLMTSGVLFAWASMPRLALAEGRDPRLLVIVLRGALDGLATVAPVGDPDWVKLRGNEAFGLSGPNPALPLDSFFAINPAMPNFHRLFHAKQAMVVHAAATGYRDRSHFDGQDVLEGGLSKPGTADDGWLNRALGALEPASGSRSKGEGFGVGPVTPLIVRGKAPVIAWTPPRLPSAGDDTLLRLLDLYQHTDPLLARALEARIAINEIAGTAQDKGGMGGMGGGGMAPRTYFSEATSAAAKFLARPDGPRLGAMAFDGWDTHAREGVVVGRLAGLLKALDDSIGAAEKGMGDSWRETVVAVVTEFGRTAHFNGTDGTDHGTGTVILLAGGALKGGRVVADWPGLSPERLYDGRDLKPTTDTRAVFKGILKDHLRLGDNILAGNVFPGTGNLRPVPDLLVTS